jgi:phospholipid/cholesterol/gamma-HCH transport system substrate-binding protein
MRFNAKQLANIAVVTAVGLLATAWAVFGLAHVSLSRPDVVRVELASSGGALPGAQVTYLGVPVGQVASARITASGVELRLNVRPRGPIPRDLAAVVRQKTALGEPYVDLEPARPDEAPANPDGAVVPQDRTQVPRTLDELFNQANALLANVQPSDVHALVEGGAGLAGHQQDLQAITDAGARLGGILSQRRTQLGQLLASSADLVQALDSHRDDLTSALSGGARLTKVFADHTAQLVDIMATGTRLGLAGSQLLAQTQGDWGGTLAGLDVSTRTLAERPVQTNEILQLVPPYLQGLARTFSQGLAWSSNGGLPPFPYQPLYGIPLEGTGLHIDQIFSPTLAGQIRMDFGGANPGGAILLLTPDQFQRASQSPQAFEQVKAEALARLQQVGPTFGVGTAGPDATQ